MSESVSPKRVMVSGPPGHQWDGMRVQVIEAFGGCIATTIGTFLKVGGAWRHTADDCIEAKPSA